MSNSHAGFGNIQEGVLNLASQNDQFREGMQTGIWDSLI